MLVRGWMADAVAAGLSAEENGCDMTSVAAVGQLVCQPGFPYRLARRADSISTPTMRNALSVVVVSSSSKSVRRPPFGLIAT